MFVLECFKGPIVSNVQSSLERVELKKESFSQRKGVVLTWDDFARFSGFAKAPFVFAQLSVLGGETLNSNRMQNCILKRVECNS